MKTIILILILSTTILLYPTSSPCIGMCVDLPCIVDGECGFDCECYIGKGELRGACVPTERKEEKKKFWEVEEDWEREYREKKAEKDFKEKWGILW